MIPLIYILPTDNIFQSASGIIHEITPKYSNFRDAVQIEFKYNLDSYFYLEILMSEFDQPESIKLYSGSTEFYSEVTDLEDSYNLIADEVVVVIEKDAILDIINNVATYQTFHDDISIDLKIIEAQQNVEDRPKINSISDWGAGLSIDIEGEVVSYYDGNVDTLYQPILGSNNGGERLPYKAQYNYFFYDIDSIVPGHTLLIIPPKDFYQHYLFRGNHALSTISIKDTGTVKFNSSEILSVTNGLVSHNGLRKGFDNYIELNPGEEYKTYLFNAAIDKNLYTEISLLIPSVKHTGMSIYDYEQSTIVRGSISQRVILDPSTDLMAHSIRMENTRDFFGAEYGYDFEFVYDPAVVFSTVRLNNTENLCDFGILYKIDIATGDREIIPLTDQTIQRNQAGMITGSNKNIFVSIAESRISDFTRDRVSKNTLPKKISKTDSIHGIYSIESIDYEDDIIVVSSGTDSETYEFSNPKVNSIIVSDGQSSLMRTDGALDIGGVTFKAPVLGINMDFINIETFNDAILLTRVAEDADYGIENIVNDCNYFMHHMHIDFGSTSLLFIFNQFKDKVYYIEFSRKVVNTDAGNIDHVIDRLITIDDERALKEFLLFHSIGTGVNRIVGVSQTIEAYPEGIAAKRIDSILTVKEDMSLGRYSFSKGVLRDYDHIVEGTAGDILYSPREYKNSEITKSFMKSKINFRSIANGMLGNNLHEIDGLDLTDHSLEVHFSLGDAKGSFTISTNGGSYEFLDNKRILMATGAENYDAHLPFQIDSTSLLSTVHQVFDMIVVEFETLGSIAFSFPAIKEMISNQDLAIGGSIMHSRSEYAILFRTTPIQNIVFESFGTISKESAKAIYQNESSDIILDILSKEKWDSHLDDDNEEREDISVYTIEENGHAGIALPLEYTKFFQLKEQ